MEQKATARVASTMNGPEKPRRILVEATLAVAFLPTIPTVILRISAASGSQRWAGKGRGSTVS
ncbi:MAG TPA: hypothetical protein VFQ36_15435 [Ktedonobacteraceae bacterium]|nr:hypothetical protein [Ktedonobacteraceae bacterium]